jgi:hypothetical protein
MRLFTDKLLVRVWYWSAIRHPPIGVAFTAACGLAKLEVSRQSGGGAVVVAVGATAVVGATVVVMGADVVVVGSPELVQSIRSRGAPEVASREWNSTSGFDPVATSRIW